MNRTTKFEALNNLRANAAGMSDYQHAFILAQDAAHRAGEIGFGNSPGMNAVAVARRASLIAALAKRVPADQRAQVRALAVKYLGVARSARRRAIAKDAESYRVAVSCYRRDLSNYWPHGATA